MIENEKAWEEMLRNSFDPRDWYGNDESPTKDQTEPVDTVKVKHRPVKPLCPRGESRNRQQTARPSAVV